MGYHLDQLYASIAGSDEDFLYSVHTYHMSFHLRVAEIGGNSLLRGAIEREQVLVFNWLFDTAAQQRSLPPHFHSELAAAVTGSTIEAADAAMRAHIRYGVDRILKAMHPSRAENGWRVLRKSTIRDMSSAKSRTAARVIARHPKILSRCRERNGESAASRLRDAGRRLGLGRFQIERSGGQFGRHRAAETHTAEDGADPTRLCDSDRCGGPGSDWPHASA